MAALRNAVLLGLDKVVERFRLIAIHNKRAHYIGCAVARTS
jgi:hypothetical protein